MLKKISYLLNKRDKKILVGIFFLVLGLALLDLISVSLLLPIVELLEKGQSVIETNLFLNIVNRIFGIGGDVKILCLTSLGLLCFLFIFKCCYALLSVYFINRFTMSYSRRLTKKLMTAYLSFPYEFHLDNNSSTLIRKSTYDVDMFTTSVTEILNFIVKMASTIAIIIFLFIKDWRVTLILFVLLSLFSVLVIFVIRPYSKRIGVGLQQLNSNNYKYLSQAFNGIKESKISNSESYFTNVYDSNRIKINRNLLKRVVINNIPINTIEMVGMVGVCLALAVTILIGTKPEDIVVTFSVFAYAVVKLLPSVSVISSTLNDLHFYSVSIKSLYDDIKASENTSYSEPITDNKKTLEFKNEIIIDNVDFFYSSLPEKKVLKNVSFKIKKNTSVAISGVSGAGKTTIIDIVLGLLPCRSGKVLCDGVDIKENMRGWRKNISYIPQNIYLSDDTIRNNVAFGVDTTSVDDEKIWDALEKAQLKDYVNNLPKKLDTVIGERGIRMSGGQRQRIGIARAFFRNTNIIVFDEATSALDYETEKNILDHVSQYASDHTLIIITHRLNTIDSCNSIFKVEGGNITQIK